MRGLIYGGVMPETVISPSSSNDYLPFDIWTSVNLCLCRLSQGLNLIQATPGFCRLAGLDLPLPANTEIATLIHPEDHSDFQGFISAISSEDTLIPSQILRMVTPDGRVTRVEVRAEAIGPVDQPDVMLMFVDSQPDQRLDEQADQDSLAEFWSVSESLMAGILDAVMLVSIEGKIVQFNAAAEILLGYPSYEIMGRPVGSLFSKSADGVQKATLRFARIMKLGRVRDVSMNVYSREGEKVSVLLNGSVVRSRSNELIGLVLIFRDMTKDRSMKELRLKNRELTRAYDKLKTLDNLKDNLMSLVGHELRAPLSNILGYSEFLTGEVSEEESKQFSRIIYDESRRLSRLVNDILDMSRIDAGKLNYYFVKDSLNRLVEVSLDAVSKMARAKDIRLVLDLDRELEPMEFDPDRIEQVIVNILTNAIKFTPEGKSITISTEREDEAQRLSIKDEGRGIPEDQAYKVFNKFEQIDELRHHTDGSGLGMPIAKGIIEEGHAGSIWFESDGLDTGATFYFRLPQVKRL